MQNKSLLIGIIVFFKLVSVNAQQIRNDTIDDVFTKYSNYAALADNIFIEITTGKTDSLVICYLNQSIGIHSKKDLKKQFLWYANIYGSKEDLDEKLLPLTILSQYNFVQENKDEFKILKLRFVYDFGETGCDNIFFPNKLEIIFSNIINYEADFEFLFHNCNNMSKIREKVRSFPEPIFKKNK